MSHHENGNATLEQAPQLPTPDPALRRLDPFIGSWQMTGRTLGSDIDNISARTTFEWLPGSFFLVQRFEADFAGFAISSLEVIGYDPESGTFPSTVYPSMAGTPLPYRWLIDDSGGLTIKAEALGATFRGRWTEGGTVFSGGWRPDPGHEGPGNVPYDISGRRAE